MDHDLEDTRESIPRLETKGPQFDRYELGAIKEAPEDLVKKLEKFSPTRRGLQNELESARSARGKFE